ncbi:hypothetical protein ACHQM5_013458 [Ranunculus cassubicifolius]
MGDLEGLGLQPSGFLIDDPLCSTPSISPLLSNPSPASISNDCWQRAEKNVLEIIRLVQPTVVSEQTRKGIIEFLQELIRCNLGIEIFPFGSVPLKTYLPDGDIDLTALSLQTFEDSLANEVRAVLERAENNKDSGFVVKDVQYINAEVKLIKCLVQNIVVDISFNQSGGLSTLCFLEQVDRLIGKDHLFKRSIILIKSWCYYESRILGAHHGLISTYALETMVLYIFQLFHSSFDGPLAVLYRFLDYYSKFDWDRYCISLYGPVSISSLPEIAAETPDNDGGELLLEREFLRDCVEMFTVPSRGPDSKSFPQKNFNIVDPLKENNNLGRSVSKGNFYRIRSAFTYGARKLGQILLLQVDDVCEELNKFFTNTLERHGSGQRPDVPGTPSASGSTSASSDSAADEGPTENWSHRRPSGGLISSLEMLERLGYIKGKTGISACPLVGDSSKLLINTKVDSSGGDGSAASDGSSGSSTPESDGISVSSAEESGEALPDLDGDYDNHMYSLACARSCSDGGPYLHFAPAHSSEFHQNPQFSYDMYQGLPHMPYTANGFSHMNGVYQGPHYYHHVPPGYGVDDATSRHRVHRGTGTYLPNLHNGGASYRERYSSGKRRSGPPLPHNNNQPARSLRESNLAGKHVAPHERLPQRNPSQAKQPLPTAPPGFGLSLPNGNGFTSVLEKVEFGSLGQFPLSSTKDSKNQQVISNNKQQHTKVGTTSCSSKSKPVSGPNVEGSKRKEFHLKNEAEFPPLGVPVAVAAAGQSSR